MKKQLACMLTLCMALAAGVSQAEPGNPGFETVPPVGGSPMGDWNTFSGGPGAASLQATLMPHSGTGHMDLQVGGANAFAGVYQRLVSTVNPGDIVTLTGYHKSLVDPFNATRELKLEWQPATGQPGIPQLRVDTLEIPTEYTQFSLQGVAPAGTVGLVVTYAISSFGAGQGEANVYLDDMNVSIERIIPEPTSAMLGLLGLVGMAGLVRRR
jgi:hypothetical protein